MNTHNKEFEKRKETLDYWTNKSQDLLISAKVIWDAMTDSNSLELNCQSTYTMLMGMSLELLFKAHCHVAGIRFDHIHDLEKLAKSANLQTSKSENQIFKILSEYIIWDGRYPIPKKPQHLEQHWKNQNKVLYDNIGQLPFQVSNKLLEFESLMSIWRKYSNQLVSDDLIND